MHRLLRIVAAAVLAGSLFAGGAALAEDHGDGHERGHERGRGWGHGDGGWRGGPDRGGDWRGGDWRGGPAPVGGRGAGEWRGARGGPRWAEPAPPQVYAPFPGAPAYPRRPPPGYGLRRGGQIPPQYRGAVVPDYGRHRLRPPPPGFAWVRMGGRYMLVSRTTGQIFDVIGE